MADPRAAQIRGVNHSGSTSQDRPRAAPGADAAERLRQAILVRDDWLRAGLSTAPADVGAAEAVITELYELAGEPGPAFEWVPSPAAALPVAAASGGSFRPGRLRSDATPGTGREWPTAARLASVVSGLRERLDAQISQATRRAFARSTWSGFRPDLARLWLPRGGMDELAARPAEALAAGGRLPDILALAVRDCLHATLRDAVCAPVRAALPGPALEAAGLAWYGQQDASWIGSHDAWRRAGLVRYRAADDRQLDRWAALARAAGWWWPATGRCVIAARPVALHAEPAPAGQHGQLRLHHGDEPAIRFGDGFGLHVLHGTPVPGWVITNPTAGRITREPSVEVRRAAIERLGWDAYIDQARLALVAARPDPGNPGGQLHLYDLPRPWGPPDRVLLATNGSPEPDGQHRRYALNVPAAIDDPVAAAGWTYGLTADQYAQLARRT